MKMQIEMMVEKLESDDLNVLATGLDEAKALVNDHVHRCVDLLFASHAENR